MKFKGPRKNRILSPFIVIPLMRKIGFKEMNVQKLRNLVKTEFVKSGIQCSYESSGLIKGLSRLLQKSVFGE